MPALPPTVRYSYSMGTSTVPLMMGIAASQRLSSRYSYGYQVSIPDTTRIGHNPLNVVRSISWGGGRPGRGGGGGASRDDRTGRPPNNTVPYARYIAKPRVRPAGLWHLLAESSRQPHPARGRAGSSPARDSRHVMAASHHQCQYRVITHHSSADIGNISTCGLEFYLKILELWRSCNSASAH